MRSSSVGMSIVLPSLNANATGLPDLPSRRLADNSRKYEACSIKQPGNGLTQFGDTKRLAEDRIDVIITINQFFLVSCYHQNWDGRCRELDIICQFTSLHSRHEIIDDDQIKTPLAK